MSQSPELFAQNPAALWKEKIRVSLTESGTGVDNVPRDAAWLQPNNEPTTTAYMPVVQFATSSPHAELLVSGKLPLANAVCRIGKSVPRHNDADTLPRLQSRRVRCDVDP